MKDVKTALEVNRDTGVLVEYQEAKVIELLTGEKGKVWINVDGVCVLRIKHVGIVVVDTTLALSTDKRV